MSLYFEYERCQGTELRLSVKWQGPEAAGEAGEGRGLGGKGTIWTETEPTNRACLKPVTEMSSREATTGILLRWAGFQASGVGEAVWVYFVAVELHVKGY